MAVKKKSPSVLKRDRQNARKAAVNSRVKTSTRTYVRKAQDLVAAGKLDEAAAAITQAVSALDKAAEKGVIHKNNAARRKSRLMAALNRAKAGPAAA